MPNNLAINHKSFSDNYGLFQGDNQNCYIVQTKIITSDSHMRNIRLGQF